jgi:hypothetical protein
MKRLAKSLFQPVLLIAALLALYSIDTVAQLSPEEQLAVAEARWAANKPKVYEFSFKLLACCVIRVTGQDRSR